MSTPTNKTQTRRRKGVPPPPTKTRVAMKAPRESDAKGMDTFGNKLVTNAEANPSMFVSPPYLQPLKDALAVLSKAIVAAEGGPDAAQTALVTATTKVHEVIAQHAGWVQSGANKLVPTDAVTFITAAGFQVAKKPHRVTLTAPELSNGVPGVVHFELPKTLGAIMWFSEVSTDGGKTFVRSVDTEHRKGALTGLPSGQSVTVRLRAFVRGTGYTPWTTLSIIVT
jgi:hypothetical protein